MDKGEDNADESELEQVINSTSGYDVLADLGLQHLKLLKHRQGHCLRRDREAHADYDRAHETHVKQIPEDDKACQERDSSVEQRDKRRLRDVLPEVLHVDLQAHKEEQQQYAKVCKECYQLLIPAAHDMGPDERDAKDKACEQLAHDPRDAEMPCSLTEGISQNDDYKQSKHGIQCSTSL
jgi:hypothetical protein